MVVFNKWDLVATEDREDILAGVGDRLAFLGTAPVLRVSAHTGRGVHKILPALHESVEAYHRRIPTGALNRALRDIQAAHPAPGARIRYGVQGAIDPPPSPCSPPGGCRPTYLRYIERGLRERFELGRHPAQAAGARQRRALGAAVPWCDECDQLVEDEDLTEDGACPTCGTELVERAAPIPWYFKFMVVAPSSTWAGGPTRASTG